MEISNDPEAGLTAFAPLVRGRRSRKCISFKTKMEIIRRLSAGETASSLSRFYKVNESSIRTIAKNAEKIKTSVAHSNPLSVGLTSRLRNPLVTKMEKILTNWIEEQDKTAEPINSLNIRAKALSIYKSLQMESASGTAENFAASKGWYHKFSIRLRHLNSKKASDTAEADPITASVYWDEIKLAIASEGYSSQQIFNTHQTSLFWKRMPARAYNVTSIDSALNIQSAREKLSLLLCNNIDGTFKCKPLLVYSSEYNQTLKDKHNYSVYLKSNSKGRITNRIFEDWFMNCFCVELERFCILRGTEFKGLLILDNAPGYPTYLPNLHQNVRVVFLPMDITLAMQPMHQGIVATFKLHYLKWMFAQIADSPCDLNESKVKRFLYTYSILSAIGNIVRAWDDVKVTTMNGVWDMLCKDGICYMTGSMEFSDLSAEMMEILRLGRIIGGEGFEDVQESDVVELAENVEEIPLEESEERELDQDSDRDSVKMLDDVELDLTKMSYFFDLAEKLTAEAIELDPNMERSVQFSKDIRSALAVYRDIYRKKMMAFQNNDMKS